MIVFLLSGCTAKKTEEFLIEPEESIAVISNRVESIHTDYSMEYGFDYMLSQHEPEQGSYLGAYILSNRKINYDIRNFERLTGKEHLIYNYHMKLGDAFPLNWILSCIAQSKMPLLTINPPNSYNPFDLQLLQKLADDLRLLQIPMFVQFYPDPNKHQYNPEKYIQFYQDAYTMLKDSTEKVALVWSVSNKSLGEAEKYFPTDAYTDWVGINIYQAIAANEYPYERNILQDIDYFYNQYWETKPIMLSQVAVSHYTSRNHKYYIPQAVEEISTLYAELRKEYPRIKSVVYMDFNNVELSKASIRDNFSITDNEAILEIYKDSISNNFYLSQLHESSEDDSATQMRKSKFQVRKLGEAFFISAMSLQEELKLEGVSYTQSIDIDGGRYFSLADLKQRGMLDYIVIENTVKIILI